MRKKLFSLVAVFALLVGMILSPKVQIQAVTSDCELQLRMVGDNPSGLTVGETYIIEVYLKEVSAVDEIYFVFNYDEKIQVDASALKPSDGWGVAYTDGAGCYIMHMSGYADSSDKGEAILQIPVVANMSNPASMWLSDINPAYNGEDLYENGTSDTLVIGNAPADDEYDFQMELEDVEAESEVVIPVQIVKNVGINGLGLSISFDTDVLTFEQITIESGYKNKISLQSVYEEAGKGRIGASFLAADAMTDTGVFANLHFKIKDNLKAGTVSTVNVEVLQVTNKTEDLTAGAAASATVTVKAEVVYEEGDVTGDGKINLLDALTILRYYNGEITLTDSQLEAADTNSDGKVNLMDALQILRYYNGEIAKL